MNITSEYLASLGLNPTIAERFYENIFILTYDNGCHLWTGCTSCGWYGMISNQPYGTIRTHVLSFLLNNGAIPKGMCVLHKCHNPICVRPDHLKLGTPADNAADKVAAGRQNKHCPWARGASNGNAKKAAALRVTMLKERKKPIRGDQLPQIQPTPAYLDSLGFIQTLPERFWEKVQKNSDEACWPWLAGGRQRGYGCIGVAWLPDKKRAWILDAHVVSWLLNRGRIPDGMCVLHDCPGGDDRLCVNPNHLMLGTKADNARDMVAKGRWRGATGEAHRSCKLSDQMIHEIRSSSENPMALAARFAITIGHVYKILRGASRRHI